MLKSALAKMPQVFAADTLQIGFDSAAQSRVLMIKLSEGLLHGRVKSENNHIYDVYIDLRIFPVGTLRCSCAESKPCQHMAACLFFLQKRDKIDVDVTIYKPIEVIATVAPITLEADDAEWYSDTIATQNDFFAYQLGIVINGEQVDLVPLILPLLRNMTSQEINNFSNEKNIYLPLDSGRRLAIQFGRVKPLLLLLLNYMQSSSYDGVLLHSYQIALMQEAEEAIRASIGRWRGTEIFVSQLKQLSKTTELPIITLPQGLNATLRDYQHQGVNWLQFLRQHNFAGILADDMGLGKTIQTLANLQYEKEQGRLLSPCLIVAPTSLMGNWQEETQRFTPKLKLLVFHGFDRHAVDLSQYDIVLTTYGVLQRDKSRLVVMNFYYVILDEAQSIKNSHTKIRHIVQQLQSQNRLCLTGTPVENHLEELWSLFHFLMPGLLGQKTHFRHFFRYPIEKQGDMERKAVLMRRVQPFILRRTKQGVMKELPIKTEILHTIELTGTQRDVYESIRVSMEQKVRAALASMGLVKSRWMILDALLKLRQICCDPRLLQLPEAAIAHGCSAKLEALMTLLDTLIAEGRVVLVFSQFTSMLSLIEQELLQRKYAYLKLTGKTRARNTLIQQFQAGEAPIFLISLRAGGVGLNLTRADTVILYDPWWNPAVQDQAIARSHRMGQEMPVFVYQLVASGTVEEKMLEMQQKKRALIDGILSTSNGKNFQLTEEAIMELFKDK